MLRKVLFNIAKSHYVGFIIRFGFQYLSSILPVKKVFQSKKVIAFYHPKPSYKGHMLFVPTKGIRNLIDLAKPVNCSYFIEIWRSIQNVLTQQPINDLYVICSNGGLRQEIQQVHFHLFQGHKVVNKYFINESDKEIFRNNSINVLKHPESDWEVHLVILPTSLRTENNTETEINQFLHNTIKIIPTLNSKFQLEKLGYSIVYQNDQEHKFISTPIIHITAGKKLLKT